MRPDQKPQELERSRNPNQKPQTGTKVCVRVCVGTLTHLIINLFWDRARTKIRLGYPGTGQKMAGKGTPKRRRFPRDLI